MVDLNLPKFNFRLDETGKSIFDPIRKKFVVLTPEEWVRQHFINYLIHDRNCPPSLFKIEFGVKYNKLQKRPDIVVYDRSANPALIVECKAPAVKLSQETFEQLSVYNKILKAPFAVITNGIAHYCASLEHNTGQYQFVPEIPDYSELIK